MSEPNEATTAATAEFTQALCNVLASQRDEAASRGAEYLARAIVAEAALKQLAEQVPALKKRIEELEPAPTGVDPII